MARNDRKKPQKTLKEKRKLKRERKQSNKA